MKSATTGMVWGLVPLWLMIGAGIMLARWESTWVVDDRTYMEMIDGVVKTGLPRINNGPIDTFPELISRWNYARESYLWGLLTPGYVYLAAPAFAWDGVRAVIKLNLVALAILALGVYLLTTYLTDRQQLGLLAAYLALLGVPSWTYFWTTSPYPLGMTASLWGLYCTIRAPHEPSSQRRALWFLSGLLSALAVACHVVFLLVSLCSLIAALGLKNQNGRPEFVAVHLVARPLIYLIAGIAVAMAPVAIVNVIRFGSANPISYGPMAWPQLQNQSVTAALTVGLPVVIWAGFVALLILLRRRWVRLVVAATALAAATAIPSLSAPLRVAFALFVDTTHLDLGPWFPLAEDGLGHMGGSWVIKPILAASPFLFSATVLLCCPRPLWTRGTIILLFACFGGFLTVAMRASMPAHLAIGFPFLHFRYGLVIAAPLCILAILAMRHMHIRARHWVLFVGTAAILVTWFLSVADDGSHARRWVVLRLSLYAGLGLVLLTLWYYHQARKRVLELASYLFFCLAGLGIAATMAIDLPAIVHWRHDQEHRWRTVHKLTPHRFALIGGEALIDPVLSLRRKRDLQYLPLGTHWDVSEASWGSLSHEQVPIDLLKFWKDEGRLVFFFPPPGTVAWPGTDIEVLDPQTGFSQIHAH